MATKIKAEILEDIYDSLEYKLKDACQYYGRTGNKKQKEKYNKETGEYEPQFDDNGDPIMEDEWEYIAYTAEELANNADVRTRIDVIKQIMKDIEKML